jgi:hypothetical protein
MSTTAIAPPRARARAASPLFVLLCCAPLAAGHILLMAQPLPLYDFITYWAAGHLFLGGSNPYSLPAVLAVERSQGWPFAQPIVMLCPPWTLPIVAMLGTVPLHAARIAWLAISIILNGTSAAGLWLYFGGARRQAWIALVVALTFVPIAGADRFGQITPLILASITAFLFLLRSRRDLCAGAVLLGFGLKPHLLYLVWMALLLWIVQSRRWKVLAGAIASYAAATATAVLYNRHALDYLHNTFGAAMDTACGFGGALRHAFGMEHAWLQLLPPMIGALWFAYYWRSHRQTWNWRDHLPMLLVVSVASSPYCWSHDFILILPAIIALVVRQAWRSARVLAFYVVLQLPIFAEFLFTEKSMAGKAIAAALSSLWLAIYWLANSEISAEPLIAKKLS